MHSHLKIFDAFKSFATPSFFVNISCALYYHALLRPKVNVKFLRVENASLHFTECVPFQRPEQSSPNQLTPFNNKHLFLLNRLF